jgi:C-terminal processing protease CtpA/Prc
VEAQEVTDVIRQLVALLNEHYLDPAAAAAISQVLETTLAEGRYSGDELALADAVTKDLQSINGDKHLRLLYHVDPLPETEPGDDTEEYAAMSRWADDTTCGIARVERLRGNVGYLDIDPVLFPVAHCGEAMSAAMTILAATNALIIDVRHCLGGDPAMVAWLCSYIHGRDPARLSGLLERGIVTQSSTLPFVPGRRFGATKPVYVLTSATTFSGGEQLTYDLQQLGRATIVGEVTRGGAHARESFRIHPHLEATISVARGINPISNGNWEGTGVTPDVAVPAEQALDRAHQLALERATAVSD